MKKFGTPIGAGVGKANENVGFCGVGSPVEVRNGACSLFTVVAAGAAGATPFTTARPCTCPDTELLGVEGLGDPCVGARMGDCEVDGPDAAGVLAALGAAAVTAGGGGIAGVHDSVSERIGSLTGNDRFDSGVPGGTSMVNGICTPPSSVTVTTYCSAEAEGIQARVIAAARPPIATAN
jgi:hypothetical protein